MNDNPAMFRKLALSEMVRSAVQSHVKHQPIANDDRIDALLSRLAEAERASDGKTHSAR